MMTGARNMFHLMACNLRSVYAERYETPAKSYLRECFVKAFSRPAKWLSCCSVLALSEPSALCSDGERQTLNGTPAATYSNKSETLFGCIVRIAFCAPMN